MAKHAAPATSAAPYRQHANGLLLDEETLGQLPPFVATVVRDYATGRIGQRWELCEHNFDLDALDNLPCAKGSLIEIWTPGAQYWIRRDRNSGISLCRLAPHAHEDLALSSSCVWIVERKTGCNARIVVWKIRVISTDTR